MRKGATGRSGPKRKHTKSDLRSHKYTAGQQLLIFWMLNKEHRVERNDLFGCSKVPLKNKNKKKSPSNS